MKIQELETKLNILDVVKMKYQVKRTGNNFIINPCPVCGHRDHFVINPKNNSYNSFNNCCNGGGIYKYLTEVEKMSQDRAYEELCRLTGENIQAKKESVTEPKKSTVDTTNKINHITQMINQIYNTQTGIDMQYFYDRGLNKSIIDKYKLCIGNIDRTGIKRAIIPVIVDGKIVGYNARALSDDIKPKYKKPAGLDFHFLNEDYIKSPSDSEVIFVTEGEFDTLSFETEGFKSISIGGTENIGKFKELIKDSKALFVGAFDNDDAGEKTRIKYNIDIPKEYKDINEWYLNVPKSDFKAHIVSQVKSIKEQYKNDLQAELMAYKSNNALSYMDTFINGLKNAPCKAIKTGFENIDTALNGGLYSGLYFIGAISSLGKTTFTLQIADNIAVSGTDVLIFSLEMAKSELISKSISRITKEKIFNNIGVNQYPQTTRDIMNGSFYNDENMSLFVNECIKDYSSYADNIYIFEGVGDIGTEKIKDAIEKHIKITGNKPVVIIDYIQLLAPHNDRCTDKQNTDKNVLELKRISRDSDIPIIGISSLNRESYNSSISMSAFKESGAIEYSADVLIGLQLHGAGEKDFDVDQAKAKIPREVDIKILKNRNGATGQTIKYDYYPQYNYFDTCNVIESTQSKKVYRI